MPPQAQETRTGRLSVSAATPRVAILVDTSTNWGRNILGGVISYTRTHGRWQIFVEARGMEEHLQLPAGWHGDGEIARVGSERMARELRAKRLPVVNVSGIELAGAGFPRITTDLVASAQLAAQHFQEQGFRHFAYSAIGNFQLPTKRVPTLSVPEHSQQSLHRPSKPLNAELSDYAEHIQLIKSSATVLTATLSVAQLAWKPNDGAWSIADCFDHLNTVGFLLMPRLEEAVRSGRKQQLLSEGPFRYGFLGRWFVRLLRPDAERKLKTPALYRPSEISEPRTVLRRFD